MARYLVTGGCGFIGSHLVDELIALNHEVIILDNLTTGKLENVSDKAKLIIGDICDPNIVKETLENVDGCFHLAALVGIKLCEEDWLGTNKVNLTGTINIFDALSYHLRVNKKVIPIIYTSSCAIYGEIGSSLTELSLPQPLSAYGADKFSCELHARVATYVHKIPTIGLRLFNVYGPRQNPHSPYSGVISIFLDRIKRRKSVEIFGDGEQVRDFIYVSDVVDHFIHFMNQMQLAPFVVNVCTGKMYSINRLVSILETIFQKSIKRIYLPNRIGDVLYSCGDPSRAQQFGIKAKVSLEEGLKKLAFSTRT